MHRKKNPCEPYEKCASKGNCISAKIEKDFDASIGQILASFYEIKRNSPCRWTRSGWIWENVFRKAWFCVFFENWGSEWKNWPPLKLWVGDHLINLMAIKFDGLFQDFLFAVIYHLLLWKRRRKIYSRIFGAWQNVH